MRKKEGVTIRSKSLLFFLCPQGYFLKKNEEVIQLEREELNGNQGGVIAVGKLVGGKGGKALPTSVGSVQLEKQGHRRLGVLPTELCRLGKRDKKGSRRGKGITTKMRRFGGPVYLVTRAEGLAKGSGRKETTL